MRNSHFLPPLDLLYFDFCVTLTVTLRPFVLLTALLFEDYDLLISTMLYHGRRNLGGFAGGGQKGLKLN